MDSSFSRIYVQYTPSPTVHTRQCLGLHHAVGCKLVYEYVYEIRIAYTLTSVHSSKHETIRAKLCSAQKNFCVWVCERGASRTQLQTLWPQLTSGIHVLARDIHNTNKRSKATLLVSLHESWVSQSSLTSEPNWTQRITTIDKILKLFLPLFRFRFFALFYFFAGAKNTGTV